MSTSVSKTIKTGRDQTGKGMNGINLGPTAFSEAKCRFRGTFVQGVHNFSLPPMRYQTLFLLRNLSPAPCTRSSCQRLQGKVMSEAWKAKVHTMPSLSKT
jgi:hypothetical protein